MSEIHFNQLSNKVASLKGNVSSTPSFQSANYGLQADTFESGQKKGISKKAKIAIAIGALATTTLAGVLIHKRINVPTIEKAQKSFKKIFMRDDITIQDTEAILAKYKEIEKIADDKEYAQEMFKVAKKLFGLDHTNITLEIKDLGKAIGCSDGIGNLTISSNAKRKGMVNFIHHELRHSKQKDVMAFVDMDRLCGALFKRSEVQKALKEQDLYKKFLALVKQHGPNLSEKDAAEVAMSNVCEHLKSGLMAKYKKQGLGSVPYKNLDDDFVKALFKANENYVEPSLNPIGYYFNFLEKDARDSGETMQKLVKFFSK